MNKRILAVSVLALGLVACGTSSDHQQMITQLVCVNPHLGPANIVMEGKPWLTDSMFRWLGSKPSFYVYRPGDLCQYQTVPITVSQSTPDKEVSKGREKQPDVLAGEPEKVNR